MLGQGDRNTEPAVSPDSKYYALHVFLASADDDSITLTFAEVERILGFSLPRGARSSRAWWGNSRQGHTQSRAWLLAGCRVTGVDIADEWVSFSRAGGKDGAA